MKKILSPLLMIVALILVGCGGSNYSDETLIVGYGYWSEKKENIPDLQDAINTSDVEYLVQQVIEGKVIRADKDTKIAVTGEYDGGKIVEIKFLQGRYKNKVGYTLPECIIDVAKEKEREKAEQETEEKKKKERLAREEANYEKAREEEKAQLEQLKKSLSEGNQQIVCTMAKGTDAYQKLIGTTTLPEGTHLKVILAGVEKETAVQSDKTFYALFERTIIAAGRQTVTIRTADKNVYTGEIEVR